MKKLITLFIIAFSILMTQNIYAQFEEVIDFNNPLFLAADPSDMNALYISSQTGASVSRVDFSQTPPAVTQIISIAEPRGMLVVGTDLYIAQAGSEDKISKIDLTQATLVLEDYVTGIDAAEEMVVIRNEMYVSSFGTNKIFKIDMMVPNPVAADFIVNGLNGPLGMDFRGNFLYVNDFHNDRIVKVDVTDPALVLETVISEIVPGNGMAIVGHELFYASSAVDGVQKIDLNVQNPIPEIVYNGLNLHGLLTIGNTVYVADSGTEKIIRFKATAIGNECDLRLDINNLFGGVEGLPQTSQLFDNTDNTPAASDPTNGYECFLDGGLSRPIWYSFTGDGNTYQIKTTQCGASSLGDMQVAIYKGECGALEPLACSEDEDFEQNLVNAIFEIETEDGVGYSLFVDGFLPNISFQVNAFCFEVTRAEVSAATDISETNISVSPNPTTGDLQLLNVEADQIEVFDNMGKLVLAVEQTGSKLDISTLPAGFYFLKIKEGKDIFTAKVVKE